MLTPSAEVRHVVAWLPPVRWITCGVLWAALAIAFVFPHLDLPLRAAIGFGLPATICRTLLAWRGDARTGNTLRALSLAADAALLTVLLDITGGPFNPFVVMYGVYIWLAAVQVQPLTAGAVAVAALGGFGWLVADHLQAELREHHRLNDFPTHMVAMCFAGASVAELVAHYVAGARRALAERQQQLDAARERAARSERLASLTTLAAGAAHELSTPLGTIAVAAREVERALDLRPGASTATDALRADARLIRSEVERCQTILDGMTGRARGTPSGLPATLDPGALVTVLEERLQEGQRRRLAADIEPGTPAPAASGAELVQVVSSLLKNAFDAGDESSPVTIRFRFAGGMVRIEIADRGPGMSADTQRRAGEPFFTTKARGGGLGLGLFLARSFAERANGRLELTSSATGTTAILELPESA